MARFTSLLLLFCLVFCLSQGHSLPTSIRMRRSSVNTTLSCRESCVADGLGMSLVQQMCDDGEYNNLCETGKCGCPTSTRKVQISCTSQACLSNWKRKRANVGFSNVNEGRVYILTYVVQGTVYDKKTKKAGSCTIEVEGEYRPRTTGIVITKMKAQEVVDAALEAIFKVGAGKKASCVSRIKRAVQSATNDVLAMEETTVRDVSVVRESVAEVATRLD